MPKNTAGMITASFLNTGNEFAGGTFSFNNTVELIGGIIALYIAQMKQTLQSRRCNDYSCAVSTFV